MASYLVPEIEFVIFALIDGRIISSFFGELAIYVQTAKTAVICDGYVLVKPLSQCCRKRRIITSTPVKFPLQYSVLEVVISRDTVGRVGESKPLRASVA